MKNIYFVLLFALVIRLIGFGEVPNGLNRDEAAIGYNAYLISQTGKDEYGRFLPLQFESFGDWKQPLYIYASIPIITLLDLSPVSVRLLSLISGIFMIYLVYKLVLLVLPNNHKSELAGLAAAFIMSINPWHFHFSHIGLEAMLAVSLWLWGLVLLLNTRQDVKLMNYGFLMWGLSILTYHAALIFVPLGMILFVTNKWSKLKVNKKAWIGVIGLLMWLAIQKLNLKEQQYIT